MGIVDGGGSESNPYVRPELPGQQEWACARKVKDTLIAGGYGEKLRLEGSNFIYNILDSSASGRHKFFGTPQRIGYVIIGSKKVCLVMLGDNDGLAELIRGCVPSEFNFSKNVLPKSTQWLWGN